MQYRPLGKSALSLSRIGFGCMSLGDNQSDNERLLHAAIDMGINFFDTADLYAGGQNEISVGNALKEKRNKLIIATKVGNQLKAGGSGWVWNAKKEYILSAVNHSLQRLQTDYIDLYQLHGGTMDDNIDEAIEAFELLQQQGKIRYYGISSIRPNIIRAYAGRSPISSVMMQYSLLDRRPEESCLALLEDKNIGVLARGALAGGLLVDKPAKAYLNFTDATVQKAAAAISAVAAGKKTNTITALQFVLQHPAISSAVVGIRKQQQLEAAVQAIDAAPLDDQQMAMLQQSIQLNYYKEHR
jgi:aryl-alcohol dehydrogenase-like predicted oxidoreductase